MSKSLPRLGQINYINALPIDLPIREGWISLEAEIIYGTPGELNKRYQEGSLDLGAMSTFFYLQNQGFKLMPHLSISSQGPVGSVLFFCKAELHSLNSPLKTLRIAVPKASATSVNLLYILLKEDFAVTPSFVYVDAPDLAQPNIDGVLVIGDQALILDPLLSRLAHRFDLGKWWTGRFNLPMVFAAWAAQDSWYSRNGEKFDYLGGRLKESLQVGLGDAFAQVLNQAQARTGLTLPRLRQYFQQELDFSLTESHLSGINRYKSMCEKYCLFKPAGGRQGKHQEIVTELDKK